MIMAWTRSRAPILTKSFHTARYIQGSRSSVSSVSPLTTIIPLKAMRSAGSGARRREATAQCTISSNATLSRSRLAVAATETAAVRSAGPMSHHSGWRRSKARIRVSSSLTSTILAPAPAESDVPALQEPPGRTAQAGQPRQQDGHGGPGPVRLGGQAAGAEHVDGREWHVVGHADQSLGQEDGKDLRCHLRSEEHT